MKDEHKLLKIFNRNIPIEDRYTDDEIIVAFSKEYWDIEVDRKKQLYIRFFKECAKNEDIKDLCKQYETTTTVLKRIYRLFSDKHKIEFGTFWSTRFRLPKVIGLIQQRDHDTYTDIEKFETYELTPCIAYEMAKRNPKVKGLLKRHKTITQMLHDESYMFNIHMSKNFYGFSYDIEDKKELEKQYKEYEALYNQKQRTYKKLIDEDYKKFIDENIQMCTELHTSTLMELLERVEDELINNFYVYPKGYKRSISGVSTAYEEEILNSKRKKSKMEINQNTDDGGWQIRFEEITHNEFIQVQGIHTNDGNFFINNIIPNFHRQINDQNQINIPINFSLPLEEIVEYISIVKKKLNPKTPLEFLGKKLEKANNLSCMNASNEKNKKVSLDFTRGETPQQKFADLFYVYDMRKRGFTEDEVIEEFAEYYSEKEVLVSGNTVRKYFSIAIDYIDKERYKELIIGKKSSD